MSLDPAFELPKAVKKVFDKTLCLFRQKVFPVKPPKARGKPLNITADEFQHFIDTCEEHQSVGTTKYRDLNEDLKDKSGQQLKSEKFCFRSVCRRTFNRVRFYYHENEKQRKAMMDLHLRRLPHLPLLDLIIKNVYFVRRISKCHFMTFYARIERQRVKISF